MQKVSSFGSKSSSHAKNNASLDTDSFPSSLKFQPQAQSYTLMEKRFPLCKKSCLYFGSKYSSYGKYSLLTSESFPQLGFILEGRLIVSSLGRKYCIVFRQAVLCSWKKFHPQAQNMVLRQKITLGGITSQKVLSLGRKSSPMVAILSLGKRLILLRAVLNKFDKNHSNKTKIEKNLNF